MQANNILCRILFVNKLFAEGECMEKIDIVLDEIRKINTRLDGMEARINKRFDVIEDHLATVTEKINDLRISKID